MKQQLQKKKDTAALTKLSSDFYSLIPHNFGRNTPPVIDTWKSRMDTWPRIRCSTLTLHRVYSLLFRLFHIRLTLLSLPLDGGCSRRKWICSPRSTTLRSRSASLARAARILCRRRCNAFEEAISSWKLPTHIEVIRFKRGFPRVALPRGLDQNA